jgi:hypothetical protein
MKTHSSIIGYNLDDDAVTSRNSKYALAEQAVRERDIHPSSPMLTRGGGGRDVYSGTQGDVFLFYSYPARNQTAACSWADTWVVELRVTKSTKPAGVPVWQLVQAHSTVTGPGDPDLSHLRYPTVEEMRLQTWIGLGEDADGIFWFQYGNLGHEDEWIGLKDNPTLYNEVSDLGRRLNPSIRALIGSLTKISDAYSATGAYTSTMTGNGKYVILANKSCSGASYVVNGAYSSLVDVETGSTYNQGTPIPLRGGDGVLLQVIP